MLPTAMNGKWHTVVLFVLTCCLLFVAALRCEAQNLVPNPSFELQDTCPYTIGFQGTAKPISWEKWSQSPEYFDACVPGNGLDSLLDVPLNGFGFQYALDGDAYVGMAAYDGVGNFREYVGCQLLQPLVVGETYDLSFYANVAMGGTYWAPIWACNNMGMLFTMQPNIWTDLYQPPFFLRNYAHLHSTAVIADTAAWTLVSGVFTADSAYQYLVIGNFFSDALTDAIPLAPGPSLSPYYFVDGVCVSLAGGESCVFSNGIEPIGVTHLTVYPNPTSDRLQVELGEQGSYGWEVFDALGRLVRRGEFIGSHLAVAVDTWPQGEYILRISGEEREHIRFVVMH